MRPRAESVTVSGEPDGFEPPTGWVAERTPTGETRLAVSATRSGLEAAHRALISAMQPPFGVLYRLKVDRHAERPDASPGRDFVALEVSPERLFNALGACAELIYRDARAELWLRGDLGEQLVLDQDGLLYAYPDDPSWRDALASANISEHDGQTLNERDYVKHWYYADNDPVEADLFARLRLTEVPRQR